MSVAGPLHVATARALRESIIEPLGILQRKGIRNHKIGGLVIPPPISLVPTEYSKEYFLISSPRSHIRAVL